MQQEKVWCLAILVRMTLSAKIELIHFSDLSSRDQDIIQLFLQQFEKFSVHCVANWHYKVIGVKQTSEWHFTHLRCQSTISYSIVILFMSYVPSIVQELSHPIHFNTSESHSHMFSSLFRCLYINQCIFHVNSHNPCTAMWLHLLEINSISVHMYICDCFIRNLSNIQHGVLLRAFGSQTGRPRSSYILVQTRLIRRKEFL